MAASYPSGAKSFTTKADGGTISASHVNDLQDEVTAVESALLNGLAHDLKFTDATYDIGKSGATRPRDFFLSRNATISGTMQVGGTTTFTGLVGHAITTTTAVGTQADLDPSASTILRCNNATLLTISSLVGTVSGQRLTIVSVGAGQVDLTDSSAAAGTAAYRIVTGISAALSLAPGTGRAVVEYDATSSRWRVVAHDQGDWIAYTPTWTGAGGNPVIGNGTLSGRYYVRGKTCALEVQVVMGGTTTYGTGVYSWALPFTAPQAFGTFAVWILDNSAGAAYTATGRMATTTTIDAWGTANPSAGVATTSPVTFATSDQIWITGTMRLA